MISPGFLAAFVAAWGALEIFGSSPPVPLSALTALAASAACVFGFVASQGTLTAAEVFARLGLGRPTTRSMVAALTVGSAVVGTFAVGAAISGVHLHWRSNWPAVLVGALLFHGVAEELVWRGFVFGHLRRTHDRRTAIRRSMPLIALTHVPILFGNGLLVGSLAIATASVTCVPFSYLYEQGGRTIWPAAVLHGFVGMWQVPERSYPDSYQPVILLATLAVPFLVHAFGDTYFGTSAATGDRRSSQTTNPSRVQESRKAQT